METTTIIPIRWNNLVELTRTISGPEPETGGLWSLDVRMYSGICKKKKKRFCFTKSVNGSQPLFYSVFLWFFVKQTRTNLQFYFSHWFVICKDC